MPHRNLPPLGRTLPEIVPIILRQAYRHFVSGAIPRAAYQRQIERLTKEELEPRGLSLEVAESESGRAKFIIRHTRAADEEVLCVEPDGPPTPEAA